jgi:hypothetical protein
MAACKLERPAKPSAVKLEQQRRDQSESGCQQILEPLHDLRRRPFNGFIDPAQRQSRLARIGEPLGRHWKGLGQADPAGGLIDPRCAGLRRLGGAGFRPRVVGIVGIWIYIRDACPTMRRLLAEELGRVRAEWPDLPTIELRRGAGAYIGDEESVVIESIEVKRGMPRRLRSRQCRV